MEEKESEIEKEIRESRLSITEIARLLGRTRPTIYKWIEGGDPHNLQQIRDVMRSQIGNNNTYTSDVNNNLVKTLSNTIEMLNNMIEKQDNLLEYFRQELDTWKERCLNCEKYLNKRRSPED